MPRPRPQQLSPWDDFDETRPHYYLLGWIPTDITDAGGYWCLVCKELLTFEECYHAHEKGIFPYTKFLTVSRVEFDHLGIPNDFHASDYFNLEKQREVSIRSNAGKRKDKQWAPLPTVTSDPSTSSD